MGRYLELLEQCPRDKLWSCHIEELLGIGRASGEKNFGGIAMGPEADFVRKKYGPLARKTLLSALLGCLAKDFPQLGGERMLRLSAERILAVGFEHIRCREAVQHGQVLWMGIAVQDRPGWHKPLSKMQLVPLLLELVTGDDIAAILNREKVNERLLRRCLRLYRQAHKQGGLLSNCEGRRNKGRSRRIKMKLDMAPDKRRIEHVGSEDRAMLRSNLSAAADAGMGAWRWSSRWSWELATPSPKRGCHPGRKAINLSRPPSSTPNGVPYGKILRGFSLAGFGPRVPLRSTHALRSGTASLLKRL